MRLPARVFVHRLAAFGISLAMIPGCERKAPSPDECLEYAAIVRGFSSKIQLALAVDKARMDVEVEKCLTTPYDKELIACVKHRAGSRSCQLEFIARELKRGGAARGTE